MEKRRLGKSPLALFYKEKTDDHCEVHNLSISV